MVTNNVELTSVETFCDPLPVTKQRTFRRIEHRKITRVLLTYELRHPRKLSYYETIHLESAENEVIDYLDQGVEVYVDFCGKEF